MNKTISSTLDLAKELISCSSITPNDAGCQDILIKRLQSIGFKIERLPFADVQNFWARRGTDRPLFAFLGHTDVVPTGPVDQWTSPPFEPTVRDGYLYGRGANDMKGCIAAMMVALERFIEAHPKHKGSIGFLITSDEEAASINGTVKVVEHLEARQEKIDWCLVGEPSSKVSLGDVVHPGRRGSLHGRLTIHGLQGHIAYPERTKNPIHFFAEPLAKLCAESWDKGNDYFPPTTFQFSNVQAGTGATNVVPGKLEALFNFRFSTESTPEKLKERAHAILDACKIKYQIEWSLSGMPFLSKEGELTKAARQAIKEIIKVETKLSTIGGTSDGRFIAPTGAEVLEVGLVNASAHKIDECAKVEDLDTLTTIYMHILEDLLV